MGTAAGVVAAVAVAAPAVATTKYVGGGTWSYGVELGINYSDYQHPSKNHRSSVETSGIIYRSACKSPNVWASAWTYAAVSGNSAYWSNSC